MSAYCGLPVRLELSLPGRVLDLMAAGQGFRVASLDLGFPSIRSNTNDNPDRDGQQDLTAWFSARAVTIAGSIVASASGSRTASLALLAPFLDPSARPTLTYQTDLDVQPRQMTVRVADMSAPLDSISVTNWSAGFVAPSGLALGMVLNQASLGPSWLIDGGRKYDLEYDRVYPRTGYSSAISVVPSGDFPTFPVFTLYGPAFDTRITLLNEATNSIGQLQLQHDFNVPAGRYIVIDCDKRTIVWDNGQNCYGDAIAGFASWPVLYPGVSNVVSFYAEGTAGATRMVMGWYDRWLI